MVLFVSVRLLLHPPVISVRGGDLLLFAADVRLLSFRPWMVLVLVLVLVWLLVLVPVVFVVCALDLQVCFHVWRDPVVHRRRHQAEGREGLVVVLFTFLVSGPSAKGQPVKNMKQMRWMHKQYKKARLVFFTSAMRRLMSFGSLKMPSQT